MAGTAAAAVVAPTATTERPRPADRRLIERPLLNLEDWRERDLAAHARLWASNARYRRMRDNWTARLPWLRDALEEVDPGQPWVSLLDDPIDFAAGCLHGSPGFVLRAALADLTTGARLTHARPRAGAGVPGQYFATVLVPMPDGGEAAHVYPLRTFATPASLYRLARAEPRRSWSAAEVAEGVGADGRMIVDPDALRWTLATMGYAAGAIAAVVGSDGAAAA